MRRKEPEMSWTKFLAILAIMFAAVSLIYIVAEALYRPAKEYDEKQTRLSNSKR